MEQVISEQGAEPMLKDSFKGGAMAVFPGMTEFCHGIKG